MESTYQHACGAWLVRGKPQECGRLLTIAWLGYWTGTTDTRIPYMGMAMEGSYEYFISWEEEGKREGRRREERGRGKERGKERRGEGERERRGEGRREERRAEHYPPVLTSDPISLSSYHYSVLMNLLATNSLPHALPLQVTQTQRGDTQPKHSHTLAFTYKAILNS